MRLSEGDRARITDLAEKGLTSGRIAQMTGWHPSTVAWFMYCHGLKAPTRRPPARPYERRGVVVRQYSREEDAFISVLRVQGYSYQKIAELSSKRFAAARKWGSIRNRLIMLAAIEDGT